MSGLRCVRRCEKWATFRCWDFFRFTFTLRWERNIDIFDREVILKWRHVLNGRLHVTDFKTTNTWQERGLVNLKKICDVIYGLMIQEAIQQRKLNLTVCYRFIHFWDKRSLLSLTVRLLACPNSFFQFFTFLFSFLEPFRSSDPWYCIQIFDLLGIDEFFFLPLNRILIAPMQQSCRRNVPSLSNQKKKIRWNI